MREESSYFIRIERTDFRRILLSVESTNIKIVEHGKEVLLLEKASLGKYLVVKGTPQKMIDHLLESEVEAGSQEGGLFIESTVLYIGSSNHLCYVYVHVLTSFHSLLPPTDTFAQNFFLTYPAFISMTDLCEGLRTRYMGSKVERLVDETSLKEIDQDMLRKRR